MIPKANGQEPEAVERIYAAYPRKVGKPKAIAAIKHALTGIKRGEHRPDDHHDPWPPPDPEAWLLDRVEQFAKSPAGQRGRYTPHPATWFNQGRFSDPAEEWAVESRDPPVNRNNGHDPPGELVQCGPIDENVYLAAVAAEKSEGRS